MRSDYNGKMFVLMTNSGIQQQERKIQMVSIFTEKYQKYNRHGIINALGIGPSMMRGVDGNLQNKMFPAEMSAEFFHFHVRLMVWGKKGMGLEGLLGILGNRMGRV